MGELEQDLLSKMDGGADQTLRSAESLIKEPAIEADATVEASFAADILREIFYSPMNLALLAIICFLVYKIVRDRTEVPSVGAQKPNEPELPKLRRDFTVQELRQYDGNQPDGRVLVAVNGFVYDVTKGKRFYGPGGPYATFAGRDASRNLATFSVSANDKDDYDDLSDLNAMEMDSVREWEMQFKEKYELVGKLLRKGEQPTNYDDDEEDETVANVDEAASSPIEDIGNAGLRQRHVVTEAKENDTAAPNAAAAKKDVHVGSHITLDTSSKTNIADGETDC